MSIDVWSGLFALGVVGLVVAVLVVAARRRFRGWAWWGPPCLLAGGLIAVAAVVSRLDALGEDGSLSAHIAQHVVLADLAAPLLLLGLAPQVREPLGRRLEGLRDGRGRRRLGLLALSPVGAAILWSVATYVWLIPALHRLAIPEGPVHLLDHASFLAFGVLVWLAAFDFRRGPDVSDWATLKASAWTYDLPWWARHIYAMATRAALVPAIVAIWLMPSAAYYLPGQMPPDGATRHEDQVRAASLMVGFEMLLFGLAVVLAFIFAAVSEGRTRNWQPP